MSACTFNVDPDETLLNDVFILECGCDAFQAHLE